MIDRGAPALSVKIFPAGKANAVRVDISERVTSFEFDDDEGKADKVSLDLDNFDLAIFDDPLWKKGNMLEVSWGYSGAMAPAQEAVITSIKGNWLVKVEALAKSILMNKKPRTRLFEHMTRAQIVAQIAQENGYGINVREIEDTKVVLPHVSQTNLTDAQFLKSLAAREGFQFYVGADGFHFHRRKVGSKPIRRFTYYVPGTEGDVSDVLDWNLENDITVKPGEIKAKGRDPLEKKDIDVTADNSTPRETLAPVIEIVDPITGNTSLQPMGASATLLTSAPNEDAAKREAQGKFIQAQQTTVLLALSAIGDPFVAAKQVVEVFGISRRLSGRYYIKNVKHKLSSSEYTMSLSLRTDGTQGVGATNNTKSEGDLNTKDPADPSALVPVEVVSEISGETSTQFRRGAQTP